MTTNPYFLPNVDVSNYATRLLSDTVGTETIPINVFEILEYIEELGITCKFTDENLKIILNMQLQNYQKTVNGEFI